MELIHFSKLVAAKAKKQASRAALYYRDYSVAKWVEITWRELHEKVERVARALVSLGVKEEDRVAICSQNMPQALMVDFANYANRAISVPMYATASVQQIEYIVNDAEIEILCVGEQIQYDNALEVIKNSKFLKHIIVFDPSVDLKGETRAMYFEEFMRKGDDQSLQKTVDKRTKAATEDDLAIIMYTSGTTGESKGVMLPHSCLLEAMRIHDQRLVSIKRSDTSMAFLPLTHIFERAWTYFCLRQDVKVYLNQRPSDIQNTLKEVRPTLLCAVPRFWEKIAAGVQLKIDTFSPFMKAMVTWALAVGEEYNIGYRKDQKRAPFGLACRYRIADGLIFSKLKKVVGIDKGRLFPVAGAALDDKLAKFFVSLGLPIMYGYGLTETTATVCCYPYHNYAIGSMGTLMPDVQVKIGEDGEILVKGKTVCSGYYKKPEITANSFIDGWFRTGDAGKLVDGKHLYMTDRLKDLFKTSNGKYIAPQQIETILGGDVFIEQVAVIGNNRNFVTAIIAPNIEAIKGYAAQNNITYELVDELMEHPQICKMMEERIAVLQKDMAPYEKIKKFRMIKRGFTIESGELTSTLKLRRAVILQNYAAMIEEMYNPVQGPLGGYAK
ncbi:MAG: long-chain fatty acid--CoA ligase [Paludibacteraceae bacterium]|nr:long-chain fatty acid--CoA ligase [Paludibacteraceae bacterium]